MQATAFVVVRHRRAVLEALRTWAAPSVATDLFGFDSFYHRLLFALGHSDFARAPFSVHAIVPGAGEAHARALADALLRATPDSAERIEPAAAAFMRDDTYGAMRTLYRSLGPSVHLPVNVLVRWPRAQEAAATLEEFLGAHAVELGRHEIGSWSLMLVAANRTLIGPALWFAVGDASVRPEACAPVCRLREGLGVAFDDVRATHRQLARYYDLHGRLEPGAWGTILRIKAALDAQCLLSPGALGLG